MDATQTYLQNAGKPPTEAATFFDFVDTTTESTYMNKSMKSLGVYIEQNNNENDVKPEMTVKDCGMNNNNNHHHHHHHHHHHNINFENSIFWNDKDSIKIESGILDDINTWSDWGEPKGGGVTESNTDGAVYTLTVLNSNEGWYKGGEKGKKPDGNNLDIDSFLNIIPETEGNEPGSYYYGTEYHNGYVEDPKTVSMTGSVVVGNNNDWKTANNNVNDSLLRNALQGKGGFQRGYGLGKQKTGREDGSGYAESSQGTTTTTAAAMMTATQQYPMTEENSTNNIDEILGLSTMDSFAEDYEKIKKIANEVADCAKYSMSEIPMCSTNADMFLLHGNPVEGLIMNARVHNSAQNSGMTQGGKCGGGGGLAAGGKKYGKKNGGNNVANPKPNSGNGARKERSLHYCSICSKGFKDKYSVNVHVRTHTGEKPFTCNLCGKSFRQKAHLAKHYQTHLAQSQKHVGSNGSNNSGSTGGAGSSSNHSKSRSHNKILTTEQHR